MDAFQSLILNSGDIRFVFFSEIRLLRKVVMEKWMAGALAQKTAVAVIIPVPLKMQNPSRVDPGKLNFVCTQLYKRKKWRF